MLRHAVASQFNLVLHGEAQLGTCKNSIAASILPEIMAKVLALLHRVLLQQKIKRKGKQVSK